MNAPLPIRAKLIAAALSLSVVFAFTSLHDLGTRSSGDALFRVGCVVFAVGLAFFGVFASAQLQLLWGWSLALSVPFIVVLCILDFRGPLLIWASVAAFAASIGGYLLLADAGVRGYRESIRRRHVA